MPSYAGVTQLESSVSVSCNCVFERSVLKSPLAIGWSSVALADELGLEVRCLLRPFVNAILVVAVDRSATVGFTLMVPIHVTSTLQTMVERTKFEEREVVVIGHDVRARRNWHHQGCVSITTINRSAEFSPARERERQTLDTVRVEPGEFNES